MSRIEPKHFYSTFRNPQKLQKASMDLFVNQAPHLIDYIYKNRENPLYKDPEVRVGLSIKVLHNTPGPAKFPVALIDPILEDIETMIKDFDYLESTGQHKIRLKCLRNEFDLVQRYILLDDSITLNTNALADGDDQTAFDSHNLNLLTDAGDEGRLSTEKPKMVTKEEKKQRLGEEMDGEDAPCVLM